MTHAEISGVENGRAPCMVVVLLAEGAVTVSRKLASYLNDG